MHNLSKQKTLSVNHSFSAAASQERAQRTPRAVTALSTTAKFAFVLCLNVVLPTSVQALCSEQARSALQQAPVRGRRAWQQVQVCPAPSRHVRCQQSAAGNRPSLLPTHTECFFYLLSWIKKIKRKQSSQPTSTK